jgi:hypothetical protein
MAIFGPIWTQFRSKQLKMAIFGPIWTQFRDNADIFSSLLQNKHDFQLFVLESFLQR